MRDKQGLLQKLPPPPPGKTGWPWTEESSPAVYDAGITYPKITIITPSYNQGAFIEETIRSVLLQNYPALEYIIMDGGSSDNTVEIIKKYEPWLSYWVSEKDKGQSDAINKGLSKSTGKIFNWINSDDYFERDAFYAVSTEFLKGAEVVSGQCNFFVGDKITQVDNGIELKATTEESIFHHKMNQPSTFFDLDRIKQLGGIDETLHYTMDFDLLKRYLLTFTQQRVRETPKILSYFRIHENSKTSVWLERFEKDKNVIRYSILYSLQAPDYLLQAFKEKFGIPENQALRKFEVNSAVNKQRLLALYFKKFPYYFYEKRAYAEAKMCFNLIAKSRMIKSILENLSLVIRLFLIPSFMMNFLRDMKKGAQ